MIPLLYQLSYTAALKKQRLKILHCGIFVKKNLSDFVPQGKVNPVIFYCGG